MTQTMSKTSARGGGTGRSTIAARRSAEEREIKELSTRIDRALEELHAQADETMRRLGIDRGA